MSLIRKLGLLADMGSATLAFIFFKGLLNISQSNVIDKDAGNVTVCVNATGKPVRCETDDDCRNATIPPFDFRGFKAPEDTVGKTGCTCYRFGNQLSLCASIPPEPEYDIDRNYFE